MDPWLSFGTIDKNNHQPNGIEFHIEEIKEFSDTEMQLYGLIVTSNWKGYDKKHGVVKCVFGEGGKDNHSSNYKFYLVQNIGNTVKTPLIELLGDPENEATIRSIINMIYALRKEAEDNAVNMSDLSSFNLNGNMNIKPKKKYKK